MAASRLTLGVSMSSHDRAAALLMNGEVVAAVAEERLDRRKKSEGFLPRDPFGTVLPPLAAIRYVLSAADVRLEDVEIVVCGRSITTCRDDLLRYLPIDSDRVIEPPPPSHHLAHAYSAYAVAPFDECDVLVVDEQGHHTTKGFERCTWFEGIGGSPLVESARFWGGSDALSLGMFYNVFAGLCGLAEAALPAAGKLMALAPLGGEADASWPRSFELTDDGDALCGIAGLDAVLVAAGVPVRHGYESYSPGDVEGIRHKFLTVPWASRLARDLAHYAQSELERALLHIITHQQRRTGRTKLAYAGGVTLNCTANSLLLRTGYTDVFVQPAATDDGTALGLAAYGWSELQMGPRPGASRFAARLGRDYSSDDGRAAARTFGLEPYLRPASTAQVAELLTEASIVCWFSGPSEWGPRALGGRSILADPTIPGITALINSRIKHREPFRPFGLSVLDTEADTLLDRSLVPPSLEPYMLAVAPVVDARLAPLAHIDGTVRYQVVNESDHDYFALLQAFAATRGIGALLNTSFNTAGEPLVESPDDAVRQFLLSGADALYMADSLLVRADIPMPALETALNTAEARSRIDPLAHALRLEAAGYPELAREQVLRTTADLARGPDYARTRAALMMRLAVAGGCDATEHALEVLRWSGLPPAAAEAAAVLQNAERSIPRWSPGSAAFLARFAAVGGAIDVLAALGGPQA